MRAVVARVDGLTISAIDSPKNSNGISIGQMDASGMWLQSDSSRIDPPAERMYFSSAIPSPSLSTLSQDCVMMTSLFASREDLFCCPPTYEIPTAFFLAAFSLVYLLVHPVSPSPISDQSSSLSGKSVLRSDLVRVLWIPTYEASSIEVADLEILKASGSITSSWILELVVVLLMRTSLYRVVPSLRDI